MLSASTVFSETPALTKSKTGRKSCCCRQGAMVAVWDETLAPLCVGLSRFFFDY